MSAAATKAVQILTAEIPQERIKNMARPVLSAVRAAFEDPTIAAEYADWLAERSAKRKGATS